MAPPPRLRAVLIDLEGTLFQAGMLIPGAARALEAVSNRGISVGFVTNTTSRPRSTLVTELSAMGLEVPPDRILTAAIAARAHLLSRQLSRCHFLTRRELLEDFAGIETDDKAPMAIVQGDLPDELLVPALHRALRFLFDGAELITLARNRYFRGPEGLLLDVGAWTAALEYGCRRQASLAGKPARGFFLIRPPNGRRFGRRDRRRRRRSGVGRRRSSGGRHARRAGQDRQVSAGRARAFRGPARRRPRLDCRPARAACALVFGCETLITSWLARMVLAEEVSGVVATL
jgi:hypothetical protein